MDTQKLTPATPLGQADPVHTALVGLLLAFRQGLRAVEAADNDPERTARFMTTQFLSEYPLVLKGGAA